MKTVRLILVVILIFFSLKPTWAFSEKKTQKPLADWTVMIFMNGDNNLEPEALANFRDIAAIGSSDNMNIIVQFDRIGTYAQTTPNWSQTLRFRVTKNMQPLPQYAVEDIGEANMGDGKVLNDFVTWAMTKYPAKHFMLDIWDHGQGWRVMFAKQNQPILASLRQNMSFRTGSQQQHFLNLQDKSKAPLRVLVGDPFRSSTDGPYRSCSNDETNNDQLYNREVQDALTKGLNGKKIDVIGFDCCLMSMIETTFAMRNIAQVFVGSEELEPGSGWQYDDWLGRLSANTSIDAVGLGTVLVESYKFRYNRQYGDPATTMSAIDLSNMNNVCQSINDLSLSLQQSAATNNQLIVTARNNCQNYGNGYPFYHVDLIRFCDLLYQSSTDNNLRAKLKNTLDLLRASILDSYYGADRGGNFGSNGLAIYFPANSKDYKDDPYAQNGYEKDNKDYPVEFVQKIAWTDFLHKYFTLNP